MPMEYHTKHRTLTAAEIASAKDGVVTHMQQIAILDGELAEQKKKYANLLKPHKTTVKELMAMITTGVESGSAYCNVVVDPVTQTVKFFETKRVFNEDTQRHENVETLFDEKTFEEVGEKQLSIWQQESESDSIDEAIDRIDQDEWISLENMLREECSNIYADGVVMCLAKPFPAPVAAYYLSETGSPSSNVNVALSSLGARAAVNMINIDVQESDDYDATIDKLGELLFSDLVFTSSYEGGGGSILRSLITWAKGDEGDSDEDESGDDE